MTDKRKLRPAAQALTAKRLAESNRAIEELRLKLSRMRLDEKLFRVRRELPVLPCAAVRVRPPLKLVNFYGID